MLFNCTHKYGDTHCSLYHLILKCKWNYSICVKTTSHSAAAALKVTAAKQPIKPNKPAAVMSVNQRKKKKSKKEEIKHFCSFKDSSLFNLEFAV